MKANRGTILMTIGLLLLAAALFLAGYNIWDEHRAEGSAQQVLDQLVSETPQPEPPAPEEPTPEYILHPEMDMPTVEIDGSRYIGRVTIPALGLELPVMSQWSYPNLKIAPCRYQGSAYTGDLIIAGHNYRTHFGPLKNLGVGDTVLFTDADGNQFRYTVAQVETLAKTAVEEGCGRLEWACLNWNEPSIAFYCAMGAEPMDDWTVYRLTGDTLTAAAAMAEE